MKVKFDRLTAVRWSVGVIGLFLFVLVNLYDFINPNFIAVYVLFLSLFLLWYVRKNFALFIVSAILAYCNYSVVFSQYVVIKQNTIFTTFSNTEYSTQAIHIMLLFWSVLVICMSAKPLPLKMIDLKKHEKKTGNYSVIVQCILLGLAVVLVAIFYYGFDRPEIIGARGAPSAIYEYSIIIFIVSFYYSYEYKFCKILISAILFLFAMQNLVFGGRITALQLLIVFYMMVLSPQLSLKKAAPFILVGFILMSVIGVVRGTLLSGDFSVLSILENLKEQLFTLDTAYSAYHTSITMLLTELKLSWNERVVCFFDLFSSIIKGKYLGSKADISSFSRQFYVHSYGGVLPFYFHFYLGNFGVILIAFFISKVLGVCAKLSKECDSGLRKCVTVYIVASAFRWYLYSPIQITRGLLLMICVYLGLTAFIDALTNKKIIIRK